MWQPCFVLLALTHKGKGGCLGLIEKLTKQRQCHDSFDIAYLHISPHWCFDNENTLTKGILVCAVNKKNCSFPLLLVLQHQLVLNNQVGSK